MSLLFQQSFRSGLEQKVAEQLKLAGVDYGFERLTVPYTVPARDAKYLPDFVFDNAPNIIIEAKGRFGHHKSDANGAAERQKLILVKEQNPHLDVRIVFQDAKKKIYKGSKTTYAKWAEDHGFLWSDKGIVPREWIKQLKGSGNDDDCCQEATAKRGRRSTSHSAGKDRAQAPKRRRGTNAGKGAHRVRH
jgi:hypothetical protein